MKCWAARGIQAPVLVYGQGRAPSWPPDCNRNFGRWQALRTGRDVLGLDVDLYFAVTAIHCGSGAFEPAQKPGGAVCGGWAPQDQSGQRSGSQRLGGKRVR